MSPSGMADNEQDGLLASGKCTSMPFQSASAGHAPSQAARAAPTHEQPEVVGPCQLPKAVPMSCNKAIILKSGCRRSCKQESSIWADLCLCTAQSECASCKCFRLRMHFGDKQFNQMNKSITQSHFLSLKLIRGVNNRQYLRNPHTLSARSARHLTTKHQRTCLSDAAMNCKHAMMLQRVHGTCNCLSVQQAFTSAKQTLPSRSQPCLVSCHRSCPQSRLQSYPILSLTTSPILFANLPSRFQLCLLTCLHSCLPVLSPDLSPKLSLSLSPVPKFCLPSCPPSHVQSCPWKLMQGLWPCRQHGQQGFRPTKQHQQPFRPDSQPV